MTPADEAKALLAFLASRYVQARTVTDELRARLEELDRTTWRDSESQSSGKLTKDRVRLSIERSTIASAERLRALELVVSACVPEVLPPPGRPPSKPADQVPTPLHPVSPESGHSQTSELDLALAAEQLDDGERTREQGEREPHAESDDAQFSSELDSVGELRPRFADAPEGDRRTPPEAPAPEPPASEREASSPPSREAEAQDDPVRGAWGAPERGR